MPDNRELEQAKAYIRSRLSTEERMNAALTKAMRKAVDEMVDIAFRYRMSPKLFRFSRDPNLLDEINEVIRRLKEAIEEDTVKYATLPAEEDTDEIIALITARNHGKTFAQRNDTYCNRFKYEVEAAIAAGLILDAAKDKIKQLAGQHFHAPYLNPLIREAIGRPTSATRLLSNGISYGNGRTNSMHTALDILTSNAVSQGWMRHWRNLHDGASGFYSFRGSSYPCSLCQGMVGWHPISDYQGGWHIRCKCVFVFT